MMDAILTNYSLVSNEDSGHEGKKNIFKKEGEVSLWATKLLGVAGLTSMFSAAIVSFQQRDESSKDFYNRDLSDSVTDSIS